MLSFCSHKNIRSCFALDINDGFVRVCEVVYKKNKKYVKKYHSIALPYGVVKSDCIVQKKQLKVTIELACQQANITNKNVVCSVPETKTFIGHFLISTKEQDVQSAIQWYLGSNMQTAVTELYYDWFVVTEKMKKGQRYKEISVVAIPKKYIYFYKSLLQSVQLRPCCFVPKTVARSRSVLSQETGVEYTIIVHIGAHGTNITMTHYSVPISQMNSVVSMNLFVHSIKNSFGITYDKAEKIFYKYGIGSVLNNDHIFHGTQPILENLVRDIQSFIDTHKQKKVRIVVSGIGARVIGILPYLTYRLHTYVECGDPLLHCSIGLQSYSYDSRNMLQYTTPIGASLSVLKKETH